MPESRERRTEWRYVVIACAGLLLFLSGYMSKARGKVSFVEGLIGLVGSVAIVTVIAVIVEKVRNPS